MPAANPRREKISRDKVSCALSRPGQSTYSYDLAGKLIHEKHMYFRDLPPDVQHDEFGRVIQIVQRRECVRVEEFDHTAADVVVEVA